MRLGLLFSAVLFAVAGCGGTSSDKACSDLAAARCAQRAMCTSNAGVTRVFGDMTTCLAREKLSCTNGLAAKSTGSSPDRAEQCATALATESCADYFAGNSPAACVNMGALTDGTSCAFGGQCSSSYCTGTQYSACGTCGEAAASGAACGQGAGECARGLICFVPANAPNPLVGTCIAEGTQGASCSRMMPCASGFSCVGQTGGGNPMPGSCMASVATMGTSCDPTLRTGPACDGSKGLYCNAMSKTCTAIVFAQNGAPCGLGTDGNLTACASGACFGATAMAMGTCKADAADGAACDAVNGPGCLAPAKCVLSSSSSTAGTCTVADASKC